MKPNELAFLKELDDLSRKYKIVVGGCGCCGSPYIHGIEDADEHYGYVYENKIDWVDAREYFNDDGEDGYPPFVKDME